MPGLVRGVARTAVVAGTASAVSGRVHHRQQQRWAEQGQQDVVYTQPVYQQAPPPAPAPAGTSEPDTLAQLKQLGELRDAGVLTEAEFEAQKAKILAG